MEKKTLEPLQVDADIHDEHAALASLRNRTIVYPASLVSFRAAAARTIFFR